MRRLWGLGVVIAGLVGAWPPGASAAVPTEDSVVGSALVKDSIGGSPEAITIDAHSTASGDSPTGRVTVTRCAGSLGIPFCGPSGLKSGAVTCLNVRGNRAVVGFYGEPTVYGGGDGPFTVVGLAEVVDNGPGPGKDHLTYTADFVPSDSAVPYTQCPSTLPPSAATGSSSFSGQLPASTTSGAQDFTVTDAHPFPTSKDQCKKGGWAQFGFNNRRQCIRSVRQQARRECLFIRAAHGRPAFRAQYGSGPHKRHAMRRCIRARMND